MVLAIEQYFILLGVKEVLQKTGYGDATSTATVHRLAAWNGSTSNVKNIDQSILDDPKYA